MKKIYCPWCRGEMEYTGSYADGGEIWKCFGCHRKWKIREEEDSD